MIPSVSVCIPSHNEAKTLADTVNSIMGQTLFTNQGLEKEIIIAPNGCTDKTIEVTKSLQKRYPQIAVLELETASKGNAWNRLRAKAQGEYIFFVDADVVVDSSAFSAMYETLEQGFVAVGTLDIPIVKGRDYFTRLIAEKRKKKSFFNGRLYGINKLKLETILQDTEMPIDTMTDDIWLSMQIGKDNWTINDNARVYYAPISLNEAPKIVARHLRARKQVGLLDAPKSWQQKIQELYAEISDGNGIVEYGENVVRYLVRRYIKLQAQLINYRNDSVRWETAASSKQNISIGLPVKY